MEKTLPQILRRVARDHPDINCQYFKTADGSWASVTYKAFFQRVLEFAGGLLSIGVMRDDKIGVISDNRKEWLQANFAIMLLGAIDVPRGCDATEHDLKFILSAIESEICIAENSSQLKRIFKLKNDLPKLKQMILLDPPEEDILELARQHGINLFTFDQILTKGAEYNAAHPGKIEAELEKGETTDIATIIFTSGTTGDPKGCVLIHQNFIAQFDELFERIYLPVGGIMLSVLPVWHSFERTCEYIIIGQGGGIAYSKPIGSIMLADFQTINPMLFPAVPRVFEAVYQGVQRTMKKTGGFVYMLFKFFVALGRLRSKIDRRLFRKTARFGNDHIILSWIFMLIPWLLLSPLNALGGALVFKKVRAKLGNKFVAGISGGGALSPDTDNFFWTAGINVVEGYGLTETAPVVSVRPIPAPVFGTVGSAIRNVEVKVVDEQGRELPTGKKGILKIRGKTLMKGYYKRDDLTKAAIDSDGWFDSGDLALLTVNGEIVLRGRIKDTIVLRGGENIEPLPIEMKLNELSVIQRSMVIGQDQRTLGALIVPEKDEVITFAHARSISFSAYEELLQNPEIIKMFNHEIQGAICAKNGFRLFERINQFILLPNSFEIGKELSAKQDISRYRIAEIYAKEIKSMFKNAG
ncbi:MAG: long-chain fatty acid--CoA ligase [Treponemataceae bacterium]|nr:MAG: long-chain fatty acid--CoA ligase [Treponemataceae bacterium]